MVTQQLRRAAGLRADAARRPGGGRSGGCEPRVAERPRDVLAASPREGRTLEDVLSGAWEDLAAHRAATCLVCDGVMEPRYGSGPFAVGGRCRHCRSELS